MSKEYDNTNRGVLFKNGRKEKDSHPDYKGDVNVDGVEFWLSGWIKEGNKGKFISLSIQPKEKKEDEKPKTAPRKGDTSGGILDMDSDCPF